MSAEFQVTFKDLSDKRDQLVSFSNAFKEELEELYSKAKEILDMWEGAAAGTFAESFKTDYDNMTQCYEAVVDFCNKLADIITSYTDAESNNMKIFESK